MQCPSHFLASTDQLQPDIKAVPGELAAASAPPVVRVEDETSDDKVKVNGREMTTLRAPDFPIVYCSSSLFLPNGLQVSESRQQIIADDDSHSIATVDELTRAAGAGGIVIVFPRKATLSRSLSIRSIKERWWQIGIEVIIPLMVAGMGMVGAGMVLDIVQHWPVFQHLSEVFILVPALLGLKGNLEMTLASRLSTQANLGKMDQTSAAWKLIGANLALTQLQAVVVGLLASVVTMLLGWIPKRKFNFYHVLLLCSSSVLTAACASVTLGVIMGSVVFLARKCHVNPDNIATPVAGTLGDISTLTILAYVSSALFATLYDYEWLAPLLLMVVLSLTPIWWHLARRHNVTSPVLFSGWLPVVTAMIISSFGGLILDMTVTVFAGIAVFQPVVNGIGGNLVGIHSSRLSTELHRKTAPCTLPHGINTVCPNPVSAFCNKGFPARTAHILLLFVIPAHTVFMVTIHFFAAHHTHLTAAFICFYLFICFLQVAVLLMLSHALVHALWKHGSDPDNAAIPFLTAAGDLLGGLLLSAMFHILHLLGDPNALKKEE